MEKQRFSWNQAAATSFHLCTYLATKSEKLTVAGSIRRNRPFVGDIEILVVPRPGFDSILDFLISRHVFDYRLNSGGRRAFGPMNKLLVHVASGIPVDIFCTTPECWPVALVVRTGPKESNIRICMAAQKRGLKFNPYGRGFTRNDGTEIICRSEQEVFETVGLPYLPPEERERTSNSLMIWQTIWPERSRGQNPTWNAGESCAASPPRLSRRSMGKNSRQKNE